MKVFLHEIKELESELDFTESEKWLLDTVTSLDEHLDEPQVSRPTGAASLPSAVSASQRKADAHFTLKRLDDVVVVTGDLHTEIRLCCSRCLKPFMLPAHANFSSLYSKDKVMAGVAHLGRRPEDPNGEIRPIGQNQGHARHAHDFESDGDAITGRDVEIQYIDGDFIQLADVLREQLQLQIPFQPLCREDCKGMCANCGTDLNAGRCACSKFQTGSAFAALKNFPARKPDSKH